MSPHDKQQHPLNIARWRPTTSPDVLHARGLLLKRLRAFFDERGFCEVQTPVLSRDTVVDRHLDPIEVLTQAVLMTGKPNGEGPYYLQTSPEFAMKRLLAAGMPAIYQIGPVFRAAERGQLHNPEFTMVEWYRAGDDFAQGIELLTDLVQLTVDCSAPELLTYRQAFHNHVGCDPLASPLEALVDRGTAMLDVPPGWSQDKDDWLNLLFSEIVQPTLGFTRPTIVTNYPASQSALARLSADQPGTAQRFELFIRGIELANGYDELIDAGELKQRNAVVNHQRQADGKQALPVQSGLLDAMLHGLPPSSGCALGLDRLLMVHLGLTSIDEVMPFPIDRS